MSGKILSIKKSIKGTKSTKKITKAMELVAASRMKTFQGYQKDSSNYSNLINGLLSNSNIVDDFVENILFKSNSSDKDLFVVYSSDKGLCSNMNAKIFTTLEQYKNLSNNSLFIAVGKKSETYLKKNNYNVIKSFINLSETNEYLNIINIFDSCINLFLEGMVRNVYLVSPQYKSTLEFLPSIHQVLPLNPYSKEYVSYDLPKDNASSMLQSLTIVEPDKDYVIEKALEYMVLSNFFNSFMQLKAVEYSMRMVAMQNASKSCEDIIENLTIKYNTARQALITQEIIEVLSGS